MDNAQYNDYGYHSPTKLVNIVPYNTNIKSIKISRFYKKTLEFLLFRAKLLPFHSDLKN